MTLRGLSITLRHPHLLEIGQEAVAAVLAVVVTTLKLLQSLIMGL